MQRKRVVERTYFQTGKKEGWQKGTRASTNAINARSYQFLTIEVSDVVKEKR